MSVFPSSAKSHIDAPGLIRNIQAVGMLFRKYLNDFPNVSVGYEHNSILVFMIDASKLRVGFARFTKGFYHIGMPVKGSMAIGGISLCLQGVGAKDIKFGIIGLWS